MTETVEGTPGVPGSTIALTPLPDYPGLHPKWTYLDGKAIYELAFATQHGDVVRIRYQSVYSDPGMVANMPLAPRELALMVSASLVDATGAVIVISGRGMVRPARSFSLEVLPGPVDEAYWLDYWARIQTEELLAFRDQMAAADAFLPPVPATEGEPA